MVRPIRSFIISDYRLLIDAITGLISRQGAFAIADSVNPERSQDLLTKLRSSSFDVILLDSMMERADPIQVARSIRRETPGARIIVIGLGHREEAIVEFIEAGAVGYVLKDASIDELFKTITAVYNGQSPCSSRVAASISNRIVELSQKEKLALSAQRIPLTVREKDVLRLISAGLCNREIAGKLSISICTVKNHVHNILEKLKVRYRQEAVRYAYQHNLLENPWPSTFGAGHDVYSSRGQEQR